MQNFVNYFGQTIKTQNAFYLSAEGGKVSFVDARDVAAVSVQALTNDNQQQRAAICDPSNPKLNFVNKLNQKYAILLRRSNHQQIQRQEQKHLP
jgi:hypothetical protein